MHGLFHANNQMIQLYELRWISRLMKQNFQVEYVSCSMCSFNSQDISFSSSDNRIAVITAVSEGNVTFTVKLSGRRKNILDGGQKLCAAGRHVSRLLGS